MIIPSRIRSAIFEVFFRIWTSAIFGEPTSGEPTVESRLQVLDRSSAAFYSQAQYHDRQESELPQNRRKKSNNTPHERIL